MAQKKLNDFIAACNEQNGVEEVEQKNQLVLDRDKVHTLSVESVVRGENEFGDFVGLATTDAIVFFGGYEAADIERAIADSEVPFEIEVLRTQLPSQKHEGRKFNKVYAKLS